VVVHSEKKKGEVRGGSEEKGGELRNKEGRSEGGGCLGLFYVTSLK